MYGLQRYVAAAVRGQRHRKCTPSADRAALEGGESLRNVPLACKTRTRGGTTYPANLPNRIYSMTVWQMASPQAEDGEEMQIDSVQGRLTGSQKTRKRYNNHLSWQARGFFFFSPSVTTERVTQPERQEEKADKCLCIWILYSISLLMGFMDKVCRRLIVDV